MVSLGRWQRAQEYEKGYWASQAAQIAAGASKQLGWYRWRAEQLVERLNRLGLPPLKAEQTAIIEVGSGPIGVVGFLPGRERLLVDPLADFYGTNNVLTTLRDPAATYLKGGGEALPAITDTYDLAVCENCIDHVQDAKGVMRELRRVLKPRGILYLTVNCRTRWGFVMHRVISRLRLDPGHPHTFTPVKLRHLLDRFGFDILDLTVGSYSEARQADIHSTSVRARLKARLGISEYLASVIAQLRP